MTHQDALTLLADPELLRDGEASARVLDEKVWLDESRKLAIEAAYGQLVLAHLREAETNGEKLQPISLDEAYLKAGGQISRWRVVIAGCRLAAVLKVIVEQPDALQGK